MRIDELRVGDEDESMGICARFLYVACQPCAWIVHGGAVFAYPVFPLVPMAALDGAVEDAAFAPVQDYPPRYDQRIHKSKELPDTPVCTAQRIPPLLHCRPYPVQVECPRDPPRLVGQAFRLRVCADGNAILVVCRHCLVKEKAKG